MNDCHHGLKRRTPRPQRRPARLSAAVCLVLLLAACSEEADDGATANSVLTPAHAVYQLARLEVTDRIPPQQWLASREAGRDLPEDDPTVVRIKHTLAVASKRFREYPRMIANRAVQLEAMLKRKDMGAPAAQLIESLSGVPGDTRHVESFGALCQQYYNLRMQGLDADEAVKVLREGPQASN
jgi:hypothetical protein